MNSQYELCIVVQLKSHPLSLPSILTFLTIECHYDHKAWKSITEFLFLSIQYTEGRKANRNNFSSEPPRNPRPFNIFFFKCLILPDKTIFLKNQATLGHKWNIKFCKSKKSFNWIRDFKFNVFKNVHLFTRIFRYFWCRMPQIIPSL